MARAIVVPTRSPLTHVIAFGSLIFGAAGASLKTEYAEKQAIVGLSAALFVVVVGIGVYTTKFYGRG